MEECSYERQNRRQVDFSLDKNGFCFIRNKTSANRDNVEVP